MRLLTLNKYMFPLFPQRSTTFNTIASPPALTLQQVTVVFLWTIICYYFLFHLLNVLIYY